MAIWQNSKGSDYFYGVMGTDPDSKGIINYYWSKMYFGSWIGEYIVEFEISISVIKADTFITRPLLPSTVDRAVDLQNEMQIVHYDGYRYMMRAKQASEW